MGKGLKVLGVLLVVLAIGCFGVYFLYGNKFNEFKVVFNSEGGTNIVSQTIKKGEKVVKPEDPIKENSDFIEWQLDGIKYDFNSAVNRDITLNAVWNAYTTYTVEITLENEKYNSTIREGELLDLNAFNIPPKEGYKIKLYTADDKEYDLTVGINGDLALVGKYEKLQTFIVKFDSNGGTKITDVSVTEGTPVKEPAVSKDGFVFDAWYLDDIKYDFSKPVTSNMTLKAKWNDGEKVTVTFNADDKVYKTVTISENTVVTKPADPTKSGYKFIEWRLDGVAFDFKTKVSKSITLTAEFEKVTSYTVTFNSDGGSSVKSQTVEVGKKATKPADPTRDGYAFAGWQLNGKSYDFSKVVSGDITLKATWKKKYTVTFDKMNGTTNDTQIVVEGNKVTRPADPVKDGSTFEEWLYNNQTFDFTTPITKDITLTARYHLNNNPDIFPTE